MTLLSSLLLPFWCFNFCIVILYSFEKKVKNGQKELAKTSRVGEEKKMPYKTELSVYETGYEVIREAKNMNQKRLQMWTRLGNNSQRAEQGSK